MLRCIDYRSGRGIATTKSSVMSDSSAEETMFRVNYVVWRRWWHDEGKAVVDLAGSVKGSWLLRMRRSAFGGKEAVVIEPSELGWECLCIE